MGRAALVLLVCTAACEHGRVFCDPHRDRSLARISDAGYRQYPTNPADPDATPVSLYLAALDDRALVDPEGEDFPFEDVTVDVAPGSHGIRLMWATWRKRTTVGSVAAGIVSGGLLGAAGESPTAASLSRLEPERRGFLAFRATLEKGHCYELDLVGPPASAGPERACWQPVGTFPAGGADVRVWCVDRAALEQLSGKRNGPS
jgi:hypothetical protein